MQQAQVIKPRTTVDMTNAPIDLHINPNRKPGNPYAFGTLLVDDGEATESYMLLNETHNANRYAFGFNMTENSTALNLTFTTSPQAKGTNATICPHCINM